MKTHVAKVREISRQINSFYEQGKKIKIYHGTTNSTRKQVFKKGEIIDISELNQVLKVDKKGRYAIVEPNVSMDKLVSETLKYGLMPPVVMEFPGITVGGGIQGGAGESSSFKYGLFNEAFQEYEVVLGNGEVVTVSPKKNSDLFYGIVGSYGSLGVITKTTLKLIPAKKYVTLTYYKVISFEGALEILKEMVKKKVDFIDGILFSKRLGAIMVGKLSDSPEHHLARFSRSFNEWFYLHAEKITKNHTVYQESIPLKDYLFRYNRGAFWTGKHGFTLFNIPYNKVTRFFLNALLTTRVQYRFLQARNEAQNYFAQDFCLPQEKALELLNYSQEKVNIYPLWLLPIKSARKEKFSPAFIDSSLVIDIGIWGEGVKETKRFLELNRNFEDFVKKSGGRKWLYAHSYYSKEQFWKIYDRFLYEHLRGKYSAATVFQELFEKTKSSITPKMGKKNFLLDLFISPIMFPFT